MLLALIICHLSVLVAANPFHKYPFVFLLDVGNEELEKTNSEQIRVSVPGGSVALRYPAIGNGETISHVRVSGIDFGTDLKANIVDGGPGYKYVVLVFMGNPGVPFDAVVTVQTVVDTEIETQNIGDVVNSEEDANDSAEDLSDTEANNDVQSETYIQNNNAELMQSSSNMYSYADNESMDESHDDSDADEENDDADDDTEVNSDEVSNEETVDEDEYEGVSNEKDIHVQYANDIDPNIQGKAIDDSDVDDDEGGSPNEEQYSPNDYSENAIIVDNNLYSKYQALKDHLNVNGEVYSQEEFRKSSKPVYQEDPLDYEDPVAEPVYDDEEISDGVDKYRDSNNNNYIDADDSYAVAY